MRRTLKARVRADIESYLASDLDLPDDMAEAFWLADVQNDGELSAFLRWRCEVVTSLVAEIRAAVRKDAAVAVIPSVARPTGGAWYEGTDLAALASSRHRDRGLLLRAERRRDPLRYLRLESGVSAARASCAASCGRPIPIWRAADDVIAAVAALREAGIARHRLLQLRSPAAGEPGLDRRGAGRARRLRRKR